MTILWKTVEWISDKLKMLGAACLIGMTLLTCADVVGRFFGRPIFGSVEIVGFLATMAVAMALPFTDKMKGHVGVEILVRVFSQRTQAKIDICTRVLSLCLFGIVTWRMALYARTMQRSGEVSISLELPEFAIIYVTSFCFLLFTLVILKDIFDIIGKIRKR
jgi:TRAP-type C4-dicarboxylate transport system permease small subunit